MQNQGNLTASWPTSQNGNERQPGGVCGSVSSLRDVCPQICLQNPQKLSDRLWMFLCGEAGARKHARSPEHRFMGSAHYFVPVRLRQDVLDRSDRSWAVVFIYEHYRPA